MGVNLGGLGELDMTLSDLTVTYATAPVAGIPAGLQLMGTLTFLGMSAYVTFALVPGPPVTVEISATFPGSDVQTVRCWEVQDKTEWNERVGLVKASVSKLLAMGIRV